MVVQSKIFFSIASMSYLHSIIKCPPKNGQTTLQGITMVWMIPSR